jgi:hypothetical protein
VEAAVISGRVCTVVEPLPRWAKALFAAIGLGLAAAVVYSYLVDSGRIGDAKPADWRVDPSAELDQATEVIPIIVNERSCASGRTAADRISTSVRYTSGEVRISVGVRPRGGDQDCQGNPDTEHEVHLKEPLGNREVTGESWTNP